MVCRVLLDLMERRGHEVNQERWGLLVPKGLQERKGLQE